MEILSKGPLVKGWRSNEGWAGTPREGTWSGRGVAGNHPLRYAASSRRSARGRGFYAPEAKRFKRGAVLNRIERTFRSFGSYSLRI